jgi:hypothetical protein
MTNRGSTRRWIAAVLAVACTFAVIERAMAGPTSDPATAAGFGGGWLARQINSQGFIPAANGTSPNLSGTVDAALALAAANVGGQAFRRAVNFMHGQIDPFVKDSNGDDQPGALAKLIMLAVAAGEDPRNFAATGPSNNLVQRLKATERSAGPDDGLYGVQDPTFDGAFRQSLALLALVAAGAGPGADPINWLKDQQCPDKGWQAYRADTTQPCQATDPATFAGEDTNSTAIAEQAFDALGAVPPQGDPLDFLKAAQNSDGGFGYLKGTATDANSTGLAIQAIVAGVEDPGAGRWTAAGGTPLTALLALQLGCDAAEKDRGAFDFQAETPLKANLLATVQAVPGAARQPLPLEPSTPADTEPVACAPTTTTTTAPTTSTTIESGAVQAAAANAANAPVATPVVAQPRFTG